MCASDEKGGNDQRHKKHKEHKNEMGGGNDRTRDDHATDEESGNDGNEANDEMGIEGIPVRLEFSDFSRAKPSMSSSVSQKVSGIDHLLNRFCATFPRPFKIEGSSGG
jgi:hypothetical protein